MNEQQNIEQQVQEDSRISFGMLFKALKKHRRLFYKVLSVTFVIGCIIAFSIPDYYKCEVTLAPESSSSRGSSSLRALASQFGLGGGAVNGSDAVGPQLYPDLMKSVDFKISLFQIQIHKKDSTRMMSYYDYLVKEWKKPWWSDVFSAPSRLLSSLLSKPQSGNITDQHQVNSFMLTRQQTGVVGMIGRNVVCDVDKKTSVISIEVTDQDPLIAATIADSVKVRLQDFITEYRTKKVKVDLEYNKKLFREAKERYEKARQRYAAFSDANQDLVLQSVRTKLTDLENDMQLQYNAYSQLAGQLQVAEAKVQEETPAFTTIQGATVPVRNAGPARGKIIFILLFLAFLATSATIFHKEGLLKPLLGLS
ncbi:MAG: chain-length determining protein [Prevotella sp.]|nr:chain-length determining protein [Prevotella sp.]